MLGSLWAGCVGKENAAHEEVRWKPELVYTPEELVWTYIILIILQRLTDSSVLMEFPKL